MREEKVAREVAEAEFSRFLEAMDLDEDVSKLDTDDQAGFEKHKRKVVEAIMRGNLTINEKGEPVLTPSQPVRGLDKDIVFREPRGSSLKSTLGKKADDNARAMELMGALTNLPPVTFANMAMRDYKVCGSLVVLFLA
jgi:hypothetical protein